MDRDGLEKFGQCDRWISLRHCGLTAAERSGYHDQTDTPDARTILQGEGAFAAIKAEKTLVE
jgi:hypothetical protein